MFARSRLGFKEEEDEGMSLTFVAEADDFRGDLVTVVTVFELTESRDGVGSSEVAEVVNFFSSDSKPFMLRS